MHRFDAEELVTHAQARLDAALAGDVDALAPHEAAIERLAACPRAHAPAEEAAVREAVALLRLADLAVEDHLDALGRRRRRTEDRRRVGRAYAASARHGI